MLIQDEQPIQMLKQSIIMKKPSSSVRDKQNQESLNQIMYLLFVKQEYDPCLKLVSSIQSAFGQTHEFSNFIKGLIMRIKGQISQSNESLKKCLIINDKNQEVLKYISSNLYFLGRYKASIEVAHESLRFFEDWETYYTLGLCYQAQNDLKKSFENFEKAYQMSKNEQTCLQMGRIYTQAVKYKDAINVYQTGLQIAPQNTELMTVLGILYLRINENDEAIKYLQNSCDLDNNDQRSLIGLASIQQDHSEYDQSLSRYRQVLTFNPNSSQIWNNIGMCFYGQKKQIAAIACLKKALYFDPFDWIIHYNLGLVHIAIQQFKIQKNIIYNRYASAFHFFSAAISLKPDYAQSFMYLGMALNNLQDFSNCNRAFDRALSVEQDHLIYLNYCIILLQRDSQEDNLKGVELYQKFKQMHIDQQQDTRYNQEEIMEQIMIIEQYIQF